MKGSITVEAALVCPFVCAVLCFMVGVTLLLYEKVEGFGAESVEQVQQLSWNSKLIRMERLLNKWIQE